MIIEPVKLQFDVIVHYSAVFDVIHYQSGFRRHFGCHSDFQIKIGPVVDLCIGALDDVSTSHHDVRDIGHLFGTGNSKVHITVHLYISNYCKRKALKIKGKLVRFKWLAFGEPSYQINPITLE